jgi:flavodoxin
MKSLIVFYSFEGNTKFIAEEIQKITNADLLELKLKNDIKSHGFAKYFWGGKSVMQKQTPELLDFDKDINQYDRIFIGTPVWVGTFVPALRSFLKKYKFHNKEIVLFACFGGAESGVFDKTKKEINKDNKFLGQISFQEPLNNKEDNIQKLTSFLADL